jgi:DNA-binding NarL/FixJ family response regulator
MAPALVPARVGIVSDDRIFSDGILRIIAADQTLACIPISWHFPISSTAIRAAALGVVLIDARSRGVQELFTELKHAGGPPVICLAVSEDEFSALDALAVGARGVLLKSAAPEDVTKAIHVVLNGGMWATRHIVVAAWFDQSRHRPRAGSPLIEPRLTPREMEVLRHAAGGLANRDIALTLTISEATVKAHLTSIFQKLGVRGRARLAAAYHGIVSTPSKHNDSKRRPVRARLGRTTLDGVVRRSAN